MITAKIKRALAGVACLSIVSSCAYIRDTSVGIERAELRQLEERCRQHTAEGVRSVLEMRIESEDETCGAGCAEVQELRTLNHELDEMNQRLQAMNSSYSSLVRELEIYLNGGSKSDFRQYLESACGGEGRSMTSQNR